MNGVTAVNERLARMDMGIFAAVLVLLGFGVVLVFSSSFAIAQDRFGGAAFFLERQVVRVLLALVFFVVFINIDYHVWGRMSRVWYAAAIIMAIAVLALPDSHAVNGAKRWLSLGPIRFQVSEFARLAMVLMIAMRCDELGEGIQDLRTFGILLAKAGIICGLILVEPNFSVAVIMGGVALSMLFVAGARLQHVGGLVAAAVPIAFAVMLAAPYRRARVLGYLSIHGQTDAAAPGAYQAQQAMIGLGNGGLFGVGLGQGKQKYFYLPEPHTDFAFSILGEEIGLLGLIVVLALFGFIVYRGLRVAVQAPDRLGQLIAFGVTIEIAMYVLAHAAVNVGLAPTTGVPMPFLSYGGVSIIMTMVGVGILLNISSQGRRGAPAFVSAPRGASARPAVARRAR